MFYNFKYFFSILGQKHRHWTRAEAAESYQGIGEGEESVSSAGGPVRGPEPQV